MKIEDLIELLKNRLNSYKLSRDYARMNGDLERMNTADKEIIALEDTLYKLSLLIDASKSAAVKEATLAEIITDGSVSVLGEYDISSYATDPYHEQKIMDILSHMEIMDSVEKIDDYIKKKYESSPVTGEMILSAGSAYTVDIRLMMAIMELDSRFGTVGIATSTLNPGNVGNDDDGNTRTYESWQEGVTAVAEWLNRHRVIENNELEENTPTETATTTPETITPNETETATTTPETNSTATSTSETNEPEDAATSTPELITPNETETATTTPETATTTSETTATSTTP